MFSRVVLFQVIFVFQAATHPETKGIYRTQQDFTSHHLEFEAPVSSHKVTIRTHELMGAPHVTVIADGQKYYFLKLELFGYRDGLRDYRFYNNESYEILDTAGFYVYARASLQQGKGSAQVTNYYFSKTGQAPLQALTIPNLKNAYPEKAAFRYALDSQFGRDSRLLEYDKQLKCYKLKHVFLTL